jgi:hypothetical protein
VVDLELTPPGEWRSELTLHIGAANARYHGENASGLVVRAHRRCVAFAGLHSTDAGLADWLLFPNAVAHVSRRSGSAGET